MVDSNLSIRSPATFVGWAGHDGELIHGAPRRDLDRLCGARSPALDPARARQLQAHCRSI